MHCMLAWGRDPGETPLTDEEHATLEEALEGHSWARPAAGIYVIGLVYGNSERVDLLEKIKAKVQGADLKPIGLLASPVMEQAAGLYIGIADAERWEEINRRTGHFDAIKKAEESSHA